AIGISLSDIFYIFFSFIAVKSFTHISAFNYWLGIGGGCVLVVFGLQSILKKTENKPDERVRLLGKDIFKNVVKGFVLNSMHPGVVLFWMATVGGILSHSNFTTFEHTVLFATSILTTFGMDFLKLNLASKLSNYLTVGFIKKLNMVIGVVLIICGIYLTYRTVFGHGFNQ
ncbi:MAG TPA: LysE family transporter, partial [Cytophagales bacterium]|nr:LysE family transporter [Cytophagales bacterium]